MLEIKKIGLIDELDKLKEAYFEQSTSPLDGMWHFGFVPMSEHFGLYNNSELIGFICINCEGYLLQFYLENSNKRLAQEFFILITKQNGKIIGEVKGAFVSTAEPHYLSLCLDNSSEFKVNALMYQYEKNHRNTQRKIIEMDLATEQQLADYVQFASANIGAPQQWLNDYYSNLIQRKELFGYWDNGLLVASGECRLFDKYQTDFADLGVIVSQSMRGQGIAKQVLNYLTLHASTKGLKPICSTESTNLAGQKAISYAGFLSVNRIVQFEFYLTK